MTCSLCGRYDPQPRLFEHYSYINVSSQQISKTDAITTYATTYRDVRQHDSAVCRACIRRNRRVAWCLEVSGWLLLALFVFLALKLSDALMTLVGTSYRAVTPIAMIAGFVLVVAGHGKTIESGVAQLAKRSRIPDLRDEAAGRWAIVVVDEKGYREQLARSF